MITSISRYQVLEARLDGIEFIIKKIESDRNIIMNDIKLLERTHHNTLSRSSSNQKQQQVLDTKFSLLWNLLMDIRALKREKRRVLLLLNPGGPSMKIVATSFSQFTYEQSNHNVLKLEVNIFSSLLFERENDFPSGEKLSLCTLNLSPACLSLWERNEVFDGIFAMEIEYPIFANIPPYKVKNIEEAWNILHKDTENRILENGVDCGLSCELDFEYGPAKQHEGYVLKIKLNNHRAYKIFAIYMTGIKMVSSDYFYENETFSS